MEDVVGYGRPLIACALLSAGKWAPVLSPHHLPMTLQSLTLAGALDSSVQVFSGMRLESCADIDESFKRFVQQLPPSLTCLRLFSVDDVCYRVETLQQSCKLQELEIYVKDENLNQGHPASISLAETLTRMRLRRLGLHQRGCYSLYTPDIDTPQMHRTCFISEGKPNLSLEEQVDQRSCHRVTKLTLCVACIPSIIDFSSFSALAELVIADGFTGLRRHASHPFIVKGLEVVAPTLKHLTVSSLRKETCVELPQGLRLCSFVCVCKGSLRLDCDAQSLIQGLGDVLLGYTSIAGTGVALVNGLRPRLETVVLKCQQHTYEHEPQFRQRLNMCYTRGGLIGEWWYGVFEPTKDQWGYVFSRVMVWAHGRLCPSYLTFLRYSIISPHKDRDVCSGWGRDDADDDLHAHEFGVDELDDGDEDQEDGDEYDDGNDG